MTLYLISGLGADERAFKNLKFPKSWELVYIEWIPPEKNESLNDYVLRLSSQIQVKEKFAILGLSFGGIIAIELSKLLKPSKTFIVSSVATRSEIPGLYKFLGSLKIHKLIPGYFLKKVSFLTFWFFGTKIFEEKNLLRNIISNTSVEFLSWAINSLLVWQNPIRISNLVHIHGYNDRILPLNKTNADFKIIDGGHFMIFSNANEIGKIVSATMGYS